MLPDNVLEGIGEYFASRMRKIADKYLQQIGEHLRDIGKLSPSDINRAQQLRRVGVTRTQVARAVAREAGKSVRKVHVALDAAAKSDLETYSAWLKSEDEVSAAVNELMEEQYRVTAGRMENLSNSTVTTPQYAHAVDKAIQAVQTGATDYQSAIRSALKETAEAGVQVREETGEKTVAYESGRTKRLDSAVRQNVLDGVRDLSNAASQKLGEAIGADGIEISAHIDCAEDHLPWQGTQMSKAAFDELQESLARPFGKWNCRHHMYPILLGISAPAYTAEELQAMKERSMEQITIDGKTKSRYQWTQEQRRIETKIRQLKDTAIAAKAAEDDTLRRQCQRDINALTDYYKRMSKAADIPTKNERMSVSGFRAVKAPELTNAVGSRIIEAKKTTLSGKPNSITQLINEKGGITRNSYGADGMQTAQISNNDHGHKKESAFGKHGEHAHDYYYDKDGKLKHGPARELTDQERKENADIL